jgi:hypothetical protein
MRLAAISGVNGVFGDDDIERVRELALQARARAATGARAARVRRTPSKPRSAPADRPRAARRG